MRRLFSLVISLLAAVFIVMGVRWLIAINHRTPMTMNTAARSDITRENNRLIVELLSFCAY